jgi:hypothetical protein
MMSIGVMSAVLLNLLKSDRPIEEVDRLLRSRRRAWSIASDVIDRLSRRQSRSSSTLTMRA